jgi:hypothetical protein
MKRWHRICRLPSFLRMALGFANLLHMFLIKRPSHRMSLYNVHCWARGYGSVLFLQTLPVCCVCLITLPSSMAPIMRIEPNGIQTLLSYDDAREDLERSGWLVFIRKFQGFNLQVAQEFAFSFDGCREKVGDVQLEVTEEFLSQATGLPASGQKWFKNAKVEEVPWTLLFTSRKITSCDKGMPISFLKARWHDFLAVVKKFVTCEGHFRLVFLYHLRLLMSFMGFPLNMPYYLLRSLYKMGKRYKKHRSDSSLFHHGLVKILLIHQLESQNDSWDSFITLAMVTLIWVR